VEVPGEALELELGALSGLLGLALELEDLLLDGQELVDLGGDDALLAAPFDAGLELGARASRGCLPRSKGKDFALAGQGARGKDEYRPVAGQVVAAGGLRPPEQDARSRSADLAHGPVEGCLQGLQRLAGDRGALRERDARPRHGDSREEEGRCEGSAGDAIHGHLGCAASST